ncbi:MAG TPA: ATP-binding protein, partial [Candidatus Saccharimonadales bacterium]|nr:ATP-binding protein [Candidatus Saccharimonadales bacterium]
LALGGAWARPGEVSLAHHGVLFMDELPECRPEVLEVLRQPLEDGEVSVVRVIRALRYPAAFMLVAAMNPCRCGHMGDSRSECTCTPRAIEKYRARISGPLQDRIDLHVTVPAISYEEMTAPGAGESSAAVAERVRAARERQASRYLFRIDGSGGLSAGARKDAVGGAALVGRGFESQRVSGIGAEGASRGFTARRAPEGGGTIRWPPTNARAPIRLLRPSLRLDAVAEKILEGAMKHLSLSARGYHRILRVARTIADLEGSDRVRSVHVAEAVQYRVLDRPVVAATGTPGVMPGER